jgi:hypothetical protein
MKSQVIKNAIGFELAIRLKKIILFAGTLSILAFYTEPFGRSVSVHGYYRKNGTYVSPHHRSDPDRNFNNNWSTLGNINPYTGEEGKLSVPASPSVNNLPINRLGGYLAYPSEPIRHKNHEMPDILIPAITSPLSNQSQLPAPIPLPVPKLGNEIRSIPSTKFSSPSATVNQKTNISIPSEEISSPKEIPSTLSFYELQKIKDAERAKFWAAHGYNFNPEYMSAFSMDQKVKDIERAAYWKQRGYNFNSEYMSSFSMDQKVHDIERALFWKSRGYEFNPEYMSAFSMDEKVKDIERANYWKERGITFDPNIMSAFSMDREADAILRKSH